MDTIKIEKDGIRREISYSRLEQYLEKGYRIIKEVKPKSNRKTGQ